MNSLVLEDIGFLVNLVMYSGRGCYNYICKTFLAPIVHHTCCLVGLLDAVCFMEVFVLARNLHHPSVGTGFTPLDIRAKSVTCRL